MARRRPKPTYNSSVFVNCPFDSEYSSLFRSLVFTVEACGFQVRCALEVDDSGETRAEKLLRIIRDSRLGIHDISRTESNAEGLPRFNMPYELGVFVGMKAGGGAQQGKKAVLVLDRENYRYQKVLSDIAGQDIRSHGGTVGGLIHEVRGWLASKSPTLPAGAEYLTLLFDQFRREVPNILVTSHRTEKDLSNFHDFHRLVLDWLEERQVG